MIYFWSFLIGLELTIRLLRCELCSWHLFYVWFTVYRKYDGRFCWRRCCSCRWGLSLSPLINQPVSISIYLLQKKTYYQHRQMPLRCELPLLWSIVNNEVSFVSTNEARVPHSLNIQLAPCDRLPTWPFPFQRCSRSWVGRPLITAFSVV